MSKPKGIKRNDKSPVFNNELSSDSFQNSSLTQDNSDDELPDVR